MAAWSVGWLGVMHSTPWVVPEGGHARCLQYDHTSNMRWEDCWLPGDKEPGLPARWKVRFAAVDACNEMGGGKTLCVLTLWLESCWILKQGNSAVLSCGDRSGRRIAEVLIVGMQGPLPMLDLFAGVGTVSFAAQQLSRTATAQPAQCDGAEPAEQRGFEVCGMSRHKDLGPQHAGLLSYA